MFEGKVYVLLEMPASFLTALETAAKAKGQTPDVYLASVLATAATPEGQPVRSSNVVLLGHVPPWRVERQNGGETVHYTLSIRSSTPMAGARSPRS